ncbi:MAG: permease [Planctomycetota bacterium]
MRYAADVIFWGGLLRFCEAALAAAPTLLVGFVVAGVLRKLLGADATRRAFGGNTWRSLPQAWLWGMLLPVCSLGVIPVAYELRRVGLSGGTILAFALTAPLFNPLSLLYGLTLSSPAVLVAFALASLLVVTTVGYLWDRWFPGTAIESSGEPPMPPGLSRLAAVALTAARHASGPTLLYCLIGLSGSMVLAAIFPHGSLTDSMGHADRTAPLQMLLLAIPAYATPLKVMMQVGGMFVHGNSVGAAYVLLALGAGANLGLVAWAWRSYGLRKAAVFLSLFVVVVMGIAYAIEDPLYSAGSVDHPHTHAFDVYACPFRAGQGALPQKAWAKLSGEIALYEVVGLASVVTLTAVGLGVARFDPNGRIDAALVKQSEVDADERASWMNAEVPGPVLGGVAIAGLVALSIVGCFVYFPPPAETLEEMNYVRADALSYSSTRDVENAEKSIARYDDLTRRLQVGYYLRNLTLSEYQQSKARVLRGRLEQLKDIVGTAEFDEIRALTAKLSVAHRRLSQAFLPAKQ